MAKKVHHATRKAADRALAEGTITQQSRDAVVEGRMSLQHARDIGADDGPTDAAPDRSGRPDARTGPREGRETPAQDAPQETPAGPRLTSRISKNDRLSPCLCGCGKLVKGRFAAGHDMRMFRMAREHLTEGRELEPEQREYLEESGKLDRARAQVEKEEAKRREKEARKDRGNQEGAK